MKASSQYRKLKFLEVGMGIARHALAIARMFWPW